MTTVCISLLTHADGMHFPLFQKLQFFSKVYWSTESNAILNPETQSRVSPKDFTNHINSVNKIYQQLSIKFRQFFPT